MPISDHQLAEIRSARARTEALLEPQRAAEASLDWLKLPEPLGTEVALGLEAATDFRSRAIALLRALDWLAVSSPVLAIGAAFALQAFWGRTAMSGDEPADLARSNFALVLQNLSFAMIAIGAFEEVRQLASDLAPSLETSELALSAVSLRVSAAEAAWRQGQPREARALLPDRETLLRAASVQRGAGADGIRGATLVRRDNLAFELDNLETSTIAEPRTQAVRSAIVLDEIIDAVRSVLTRHGADGPTIERAKAKLEAFRPGAEPSGPAMLVQAASLMAAVEEILSPLTPGLPSTAGALTVAASALTSKDPGLLDAGLAALESLKRGADDAHNVDRWLSYVWMESLIFERRGRAAGDVDRPEEPVERHRRRQKNHPERGGAEQADHIGFEADSGRGGGSAHREWRRRLRGAGMLGGG